MQEIVQSRDESARAAAGHIGFVAHNKSTITVILLFYYNYGHDSNKFHINKQIRRTIQFLIPHELKQDGHKVSSLP